MTDRQYRVYHHDRTTLELAKFVINANTGMVEDNRGTEVNPQIVREMTREYIRRIDRMLANNDALAHITLQKVALHSVTRGRPDWELVQTLMRGFAPSDYGIYRDQVA